VETIIIDGRSVSVRAGCTVLEACRTNGVSLPTLCHLDGVSEAASCRLCLVEVMGLEKPIAACCTPVWQGMEVSTSTERLRFHRRAVVELLFASGNHVCAICPASGRCELQRLADAVGLDHFRRPAAPAPHPVDASRPRFGLDPGRCVLCSRCIRVCSEIERAHTLGVLGRGARSRLAADGPAWGESASCTDCGRCVAACPTGALFGKARAAQGLEPRANRAPAPLPEALAAGHPKRTATLWLGGCAGCHMSLLDLDERLLALAPSMDLVYSPLVDAKEFPADVDVCLVEGAVASEEHLSLLRRARERTRFLVALGDCAANGNVTAMRDVAGGVPAVVRCAWSEAAQARRDPALPGLLERVLALQDVVEVDLVVPGCPPPPDLIYYVLAELLGGRCPDLRGQRWPG